MKKQILQLILLAAAFTCFTLPGIQAQDLNIHKSDGSIISIPLNTIDSFTFVEGDSAFICGTSTVTDTNGNIYNTVQIGSQCWMKENLNVGTMISGNHNQTDNGIIEKYCYNNDPANCYVYGGLYQWDEMIQYSITPRIQGICMAGWHLPTNTEWTTLSTYLGGENVAGGKMKTTGTIEEGTGLWWYSPTNTATNESGFSGLPAGGCGSWFNQKGTNAFFWSATRFSSGYSWYRSLFYSSGGLFSYNDSQSIGLSVRCLKD